MFCRPPWQCHLYGRRLLCQTTVIRRMLRNMTGYTRHLQRFPFSREIASNLFPVYECHQSTLRLPSLRDVGKVWRHGGHLTATNADAKRFSAIRSLSRLITKTLNLAAFHHIIATSDDSELFTVQMAIEHLKVGYFQFKIHILSLIVRSAMVEKKIRKDLYVCSAMKLSAHEHLGQMITRKKHYF